ncbi:hypothetical protein [Methylobacterium phyllostachyos]|nr:hypothetical protein [Methylobacterium phyllostachyos]
MTKSREFYIQDGGERRDAPLHDPILDNEAAEIAVMRMTRERLIAQGEDPELMKRFYPLPEDKA